MARPSNKHERRNWKRKSGRTKFKPRDRYVRGEQFSEEDLAKMDEVLNRS